MHHAEHNCVLHMQVYVNTNYAKVSNGYMQDEVSVYTCTYIRTYCMTGNIVVFLHFVLRHDIFVECGYP